MLEIENLYYVRQWHLHRWFEHPEVDARSSLRCEEAWSLLNSFGDPQVVVATADDGCQLEHPAFGGLEKFAGWGYFDDGELRTTATTRNLAARMYSPGQHHGTSMCALIAAVIGGGQTVGVAPACRLLPIRLQTEANHAYVTDDEILRILDYVAERADVFLISWSKFPYFVPSSAVVDRITELTASGGRRGKGVVFVCAAGNSNCPIHFSSSVAVPYDVDFRVRSSPKPHVQSSKTFRNILTSLSGVLHVSSISSLAQRCHYSCYGPGVDLCAIEQLAGI